MTPQMALIFSYAIWTGITLGLMAIGLFLVLKLWDIGENDL